MLRFRLVMAISIVVTTLLAPHANATAAVGYQMPAPMVTTGTTLEVSLSERLTTGSQYDRNPVYLLASNGTHWLFFARSQNACNRLAACNADVQQYDIQAMTSTDGETWSNPTTISDRSGIPGTFYGRTIAATEDANGTIWVFWTSGGNGGSLYYFTHTGGTWSARGELTDSPYYFNVDVVTSPVGVTIFFENCCAATPGIYEQHTAGAGFSAPTLVAAGQAIPKAIYDSSSGQFHLAMVNTSTDFGSVYTVTGDGTTWNAPLLVAAAAGSVTNWDPTIFKSSDGAFNIFFAPDLGNGTQHIAWASSMDGTTWAGSTSKVTAAKYGTSSWWDYWPEAATVNGALSLFYTSEQGATPGTGHIMRAEVDWDHGTDHYEAIQSAVDAATDGDTIEVAEGTYTERVSISGKSVSLVGDSTSGVIVEANSGGPVDGQNTLTVNAPGSTVTISNMTVRNGDYGLRSTAGNVNVFDSTFHRNGFDGTPFPTSPTQTTVDAHYAAHGTDGGAMRIENSDESEIARNLVYENDRGIRFTDGDNGNIHHNTVYSNIQSGIYLASSTGNGNAGSTDTSVISNVIYNNLNNGILSVGGSRNSFVGNTIHDNWNAGVMVWHPSEILIDGNLIQHNNLFAFNGEGNLGDAYAGGIAVAEATIALPSTYAVRISNNAITNNELGRAAETIGILLDATLPASGVEITSNSFTQHAIDLLLRSQAATTTVHFNRFAGMVGVDNEDTSGPVDAANNWWGCNAGPNQAGCVTTNGALDADPRLVLSLDSTAITATASLTRNSANVDTSGAGTVLDGANATFAASDGSVGGPSTISNGTATVPFSPAAGTTLLSTTVDNQTVSRGITVEGTGSATQENVYPGQLNGWALTTSGSTSSVDLAIGPSPAPSGDGSLELTIGANGSDAAQARNPNFAGTRVADITNLSYSTYVSDDGSGGQNPYLILDIDADNDGDLDDSLFFEPVYQTGAYSGDTVPNQCGFATDCVNPNEWRTWNALIGGWWDGTGGPPLITLASYVAANPDAEIINSTSGAGGVRIVAGFGAGAWDNFTGNVDAFRINDTVYNFDGDNVAPTTTATLSPPANSSGWVRLPVNVDLDATDDRSGVAGISSTLTNGTDTYGPLDTAGDHETLHILDEGEWTLTFAATDVAGNTETTKSVDVKLDRTAPTATAPVVTFDGAATSTTQMSSLVNLAWSGSDALSGVKEYRVQRSVDGGSFIPVATVASPTTSKNVWLQHGKTYQFRVRTVDHAGNVSAFAVGPELSMVGDKNESDGSVVFGGAWQGPVNVASYFGGTARYALASFRTATYTFTGTNVAWVSTTGPTSGRADVRIVNTATNTVVLTTTIDLYNATNRKRQIVFVKDGLADATYELRVMVRGPGVGSGSRVDIDGFLVLDPQ